MDVPYVNFCTRLCPRPAPAPNCYRSPQRAKASPTRRFLRDAPRPAPSAPNGRPCQGRRQPEVQCVRRCGQQRGTRATNRRQPTVQTCASELLAYLEQLPDAIFRILCCGNHQSAAAVVVCRVGVRAIAEKVAERVRVLSERKERGGMRTRQHSEILCNFEPDRAGENGDVWRQGAHN